MGDDLSLPERNSVRTPMQWTAEPPNGGFSTAHPRHLPLPVISQGEYRYERVNVAAQRLDFNSMLNWTERAIRTRKECPELGWGRLRVLKTSTPAVLAHTCEWGDQTVLAVHNFSRAAATVKVELPPGTVELLPLFGRAARGPALPGGRAWLADLDGYDYRWLRLRAEARSPAT